MKRLSVMVVAGEASGDTLAAELVQALREELAMVQSRPDPHSQPLQASLEPVFFGAGQSKMAAAGVALDVDMTSHSVFGLIDVFKQLGRFVRLRNQLLDIAIARQPDLILCVDYSGFNRRLARAIKDHVRSGQGTFQNWNPRIVQFVSPQVWASRPGRAQAMARDYDELLCIFPFEKAWYAEHVPDFKVEFVGHPLLERYRDFEDRRQENTAGATASSPRSGVLLPGSRIKELKRHLPVMVEAVKIIQNQRPLAWRMVLPSEHLTQVARTMLPSEPRIEVQTGGLSEALSHADLALASSGTVTMECAFFGVPTVVMYKVSQVEYEIGKRIVTVKHIAMPNLLAGETVFPEFVQHEATPTNLAEAALDLLENAARRGQVQASLRKIIASLGGPGAARRAARSIVTLLASPSGA